MSNAMDLLLKLDKSKLKRQTQEVEIKRLSKILGETFVTNCQGITANEFQEMKDSKTPNEDMVVKGTIEPEFSSLKIIEYYGVTSAVEAVQKIYLPGEIAAIAGIITGLSGFGNDSVTEVKKLLPETKK